MFVLLWMLLCSFTKKKTGSVFPPSVTPLSTMLWSRAVMYPVIKIFYISLSSQSCTNEHYSWKPRIEWVLGQMESPSNSGSQWSHIRIQRVLQNFQTAVLLLSGQHFKNQQHKYATSNFAEYSNWSNLHNFRGCFHFCWNRTKVIPCL